MRPPAAQTGKDGPSFSLIGADAVELLVSNVQWAPGSESVTVDLSLHNRLPEVDLTAASPCWKWCIA